MSTHVADIELSEALSAITLADNKTGILALVRWHGRPIGMVRMSTKARHISPAQLEAAIEAQVKIPEPQSVGTLSPFRPVSIVVCTRDRPDTLHACLEALRSHTTAGHEVIVVDNAPTSEDTAVMVADYPYRYVCEPTPGLNYARNRGAALAQHDLIAFTDDDCMPDPNWLVALTAPYADPRVGATTGLVMPLKLETPAQERFEAYCANRRIFEPQVYRVPKTPPSTAGVVGMGANMSVRRALLRKLGGFDVRFDGGTPTLSGGDTELFARLLASGQAIVYRPEALVWHQHRRDMAGLRRVIFGYGVGLHAFLWKRLLEDGDRGVLLTAPRWLTGPPIKAIWNWLRGRPVTAPDLLLSELWGALHGPWRYYVACQQTRLVTIGEKKSASGVSV